MRAMSRSIQLMLCESVIAAGFAAVCGTTPTLSQTKQEHVHEMGQTVMPFDLNKTVHIFRMTDLGGVQSVVVKNEHDKDQIGRIRQHLQHEAKAFERGDYADPMSLHGATMPGVSELGRDHRLLFRITAGRGNYIRDSGQALSDSGSPLVWCPVVGARVRCETGVKHRIKPPRGSLQGSGLGPRPSGDALINGSVLPKAKST